MKKTELENLNNNEKEVLKAIIENEEETTGCTDEIKYFLKIPLNENQLKGYISDLQKKGIIVSDGFQTSLIIDIKEVEEVLKK